MSQQDNPQGKIETKISLDYNNLSKYFGELKEGDLPAYRHSVRKELTKLSEKYSLIKWRPLG